jgi:DNA polymerase III gamma/tau subunit
MTTDLIIPEPLRARARELAIPDSLSSDLLAAYAPFAVAGGEIKARIAATDTVTPALARDFRLSMVKVRTGSDKRRKELKADSLLRGKAIDGLHAMIEVEASSVERQMEDIEKAAERAEVARIAKLREDRLVALRQYVAQVDAYPVEKMDDAAFAELLDSSRIAHEAREAARIKAEQEAAAKAEAERIAAEEAEKKRQAELAAAKAEAEAQRKKAAEESAARQEAEAKAAAERRQAEQEAAAREAKLRAEQEAKDRAAQAEIDAAKKAAAEAEVRAKRQEDEAKAAAAREAAKVAAQRKAEEDARQAAEEAKRREAERAAAAPDAEKIEALAAAIEAMVIPQLSEHRESERNQICAQRAKFVAWLNGTAAKLRD